MVVAEQEVSPQVRVSPDRDVAHLLVPADFPREMLTAELCEVLLRDSGVEYTRAVGQAVRSLIDHAREEGGDVSAPVAESRPPVDGQDATLQWLVDPADAPAGDASDAPGDEGEGEGEDDGQEGEGASSSYYDRSAYVTVQAGQIVGRVAPATAGEDGRDVMGRTLAATPGRPLSIEFDSSLLLNGRGELIAQLAGVLVRTRDRAKVSQLLEVAECVDFSSGNIDFDGDVVVRGAVKDRFVVKATGNVEVMGVVEAAEIICGGDLYARGGMAGRERGKLDIAGHAAAKYLEAVTGEIRGDLRVERELTGCDLLIGGAVSASGATVRGGWIQVGGDVTVATLGSQAGVATRLRLGGSPLMERTLTRLTAVLKQLTDRREALTQEQQRLHQNPRPAAHEKERMTEVLFEVQQTDANLAKVHAGLETLRQRIAQSRAVTLQVARMLCQGVIVYAGGRSYRLRQDVKGPLAITADADAELVIRQGCGPQTPLARFAEVESA